MQEKNDEAQTLLSESPVSADAMFENRVDIRKSLIELLEHAPDAVKVAILDLISSLKMSLDIVKYSEMSLGGSVISTWEGLLVALTQTIVDFSKKKSSKFERMRYANPDYMHLEHRFQLLRRSYEQQTLMLEIIYDLVNTGQEFKTAGEVLEQSAEILLKELGPDLYVCRLRDESGGGWINVATNTMTLNYTPLFVLSLEESLPDHPVMCAANTTCAMYVLSNNLRSSERGGESYDCTAYAEGYRSRLSFILRDQNQQAFGIVMLYSLTENFFDRYETPFLADCSKIVSLTVGQRVEVGKDALAKASGGMAHVGNNVLSIMKNYVEMLIEDFDEFSRKVQQVEDLPLPSGVAPKCSEDAELDIPGCLDLLAAHRELLAQMKIERKLNSLHGIADCVNRLKNAIQKLLDAVNNPVIMPYIRGQEVLDLEPERHALALSPPRLPALKA